MWFWKKNGRALKSLMQKQAVAHKDPTSLGNLLVKFGLVTPEHLSHALQFQLDNPDLMLGETLVRLGQIAPERYGQLDTDLLEMAIEQQRLLKASEQEKQSAILSHFDNMTSRARDMSGALDGIQAISEQLKMRLK